MNFLRFSVPSLILLVAGGAAFAQTQSANLTRIGAAGAVRGAVKAVAPNAGVGRVIESGKTLFLNDHVTTSAGGHLQVLLLDETVFTLGPDADMVLDTFVYDPKTSAGQVSARIAKGAFRFVTGKVARAHPQNMKVGLAVGTIGVRGTVVMGETGKDGSTVINAGAGPQNDADEKFSAVIVSNAGTTREVDTTGEGVTIKPGQAPSFPADATGEIGRLSRLLMPAPAQQPAKNDPGPHRVGRDSGQLVADAKALAIDAQRRGQDLSESEQAGTSAHQNSKNVAYFPNGTSTWDQVRMIPGGSGKYSGSGTSSCTGCNVSNPTVTFGIDVDFATRQIGGGASSISMAGVITSPTTVTSGQVLTTNYSSLSGNASFNPSIGTITNGGLGATFSGTTLTLQNSGGIPAKNMQIDLSFANTSGVSSLSGSANGSR